MSTSEEKNINQRNAEGEKEGYWEEYWNGQLCRKSNYINGYFHGWGEDYFSNGQLYWKGNFVKGVIDGWWEDYDYEGNLIKETFYVNI